MKLIFAAVFIAYVLYNYVPDNGEKYDLKVYLPFLLISMHHYTIAFSFH